MQLVLSRIWNHLTVCKNWIISIIEKYLEPFEYTQMRLLVLDSKTWSHLSVCKQMIDSK